jgi:hypothetical protein
VKDRSNYDAAMIRTPSALLLLAVVGAALLAGCGGKSSAGTTTATSNPTVAKHNTGPTSTRPRPTPKQEVVLCQRAVEIMKTLPAASKARLKSSCEKVESGEAGKQQVAREVCLELAAQLASPAGRARAQKICGAP